MSTLRYAFVLALGRSGTDFLSNLFRQDPNVAAYHEPDPDDAYRMNLRYAGFNRVADGMLAARFERLSARSAGRAVHVEANSYLRYEAEWLRSNLDAALVHVVRDGRRYIESAYVRDVYTPWDRQLPVVPSDTDPASERWGAMSRFEKLCWYWDHSNRVLADSVPHCVRMEDMLRDYTAFAEGVLKPLGVEIAEPTWRRAVEQPRNTKGRYLLRKRIRRWLFPGSTGPEQAPLGVWSPEQKRIFEAQCGETMTRLGYDLAWDGDSV